MRAEGQTSASSQYVLKQHASVYNLNQVWICTSAKCQPACKNGTILSKSCTECASVSLWISLQWTKHTRTFLPSSWGIRQRGVSSAHTPGWRHNRQVSMNSTHIRNTGNPTSDLCVQNIYVYTFIALNLDSEPSSYNTLQTWHCCY